MEALCLAGGCAQLGHLDEVHHLAQIGGFHQGANAGQIGFFQSPEAVVGKRPVFAEQFHHIGIRIEDDAVVTDTGCELLTRGVPVKADEIEALMKG